GEQSLHALASLAERLAVARQVTHLAELLSRRPQLSLQLAHALRTARRRLRLRREGARFVEAGLEARGARFERGDVGHASLALGEVALARVSGNGGPDGLVGHSARALVVTARERSDAGEDDQGSKRLHSRFPPEQGTHATS